MEISILGGLIILFSILFDSLRRRVVKLEVHNCQPPIHEKACNHHFDGIEIPIKRSEEVVIMSKKQGYIYTPPEDEEQELREKRKELRKK